MFNNQFLAKVSSYYPNLKIKYKDQSKLMKFLGFILFFVHGFMTNYTTIVEDSIYFPNKTFIKIKPVTSNIMLLHELVHMYDKKKYGLLTYYFLHLFPQILIFPAVLLLLIFSWKVVLPLLFILSLPLPAYFRMLYEKRAYLADLYCMNTLNQKYKYNIDVKAQSIFFITQFYDPYYYYMWPFQNIKKDFEEAVTKIQAGFRPYEDKVFDMLDDVLTTV